MGRGIHRGFITHEELNKSLGKRNLSSENLSQALIHILDENIVLVEKKSDYKILRKKDASSKDEGKTIEKSDDPIRMYLREMGGVELLSREGEIAIAKRIEAGKDVMLNALSQSPITAQQFFEWDSKLQNDEIMVREIIDIDTNYMDDDETNGTKQKKQEPSKPKSGYGSGFFVSKIGHIITNQHVVNKCRKITIGDRIDKQVPAQLLETDKRNDLALLKADIIPAYVFPISSSIPYGTQEIVVAGYPFGNRVSSSIKFTKG